MHLATREEGRSDEEEQRDFCSDKLDLQLLDWFSDNKVCLLASLLVSSLAIKMAPVSIWLSIVLMLLGEARKRAWRGERRRRRREGRGWRREESMRS
eukprot:703481-Hanusia_phi.AAC.1